MQSPSTADPIHVATPALSFRRRMFAITAIVSVVTMPLTAIWFMVLGLPMVAAAPLVVIALRPSVGRERLVAWLLSAGAGLSLGPLIYVGAALIL